MFAEPTAPTRTCGRGTISPSSPRYIIASGGHQCLSSGTQCVRRFSNCAVHDDLRSVCAEVRVCPSGDRVFACDVGPFHVGWIGIPCFDQLTFMKIAIINRTNARPINTIWVSYSICGVKRGTISSKWLTYSWKILRPSLTKHLEFWTGILDMEVHGVLLLTVRDWFCGRPNIIRFTINCEHPDIVLCSLLAKRF